MRSSGLQIYAGHYGSGKTNLAVNMALSLKREGAEKVTLCDLDIVNPYFRTKDSADLLFDAGVRLISPDYANSSVDLPVIPAETFSIFEDSGHVVVDLGGDDAGAVALGQFAHLAERVGYDMYLVLNRYRLLTRTPAEAAEIRLEIEAASHLKFTALVNNSNLGRRTAAADVAATAGYAAEVSHLTGLPVAYTSVREDLLKDLSDKDFEGRLVPIRIYGKDAWDVWDDQQDI